MAKVLVIDDDRLCQKVLSTVFNNAGHEILLASSAEEAWETLQRHVLVDMAVLDNQLEQEWGWQFLRKIRENSAFKGLPVIVYTANIERNAFAHYVTQGVQAMHIKPYQSDVVLTELKKALEVKWTDYVMEPAESACTRLNLSLGAYSSLLATAIRSIEERTANARKRIASPNDPALFQALEGIVQQCRAVGINVADGIINKVRRNVDAQDTSGALEALNFIHSFVGMIRQRMLAVLKMEGSVARGVLPLPPEVEEALAPQAPASVASAYSRDIISKPLWQHGPQLGRLLKHRLLSDEEMAETVKRFSASALMKAFSGALDLLEAAPTLGEADAMKAALDTPGFASNYRTVLERITGTDAQADGPTRLRRVIAKEGVPKLMTVVGVARVANALPKSGLLNLRQMHVHNLAVSIIAIEAGRLLKLASQNLLAAAGLAHGCGRWMYALGEPGTYALSLALSESQGVTPGQAERALFGIDHHEAGRQLLTSLGRSDLYRDSAALYPDPAQVKEPKFVITVTVIHLAHLLAQVALAGNAVEAKAIVTRLRSPDYPAWGLLRSQDVSLIFDAPELVDTLSAVASTSIWSANHLLANAP